MTSVVKNISCQQSQIFAIAIKDIMGKVSRSLMLLFSFWTDRDKEQKTNINHKRQTQVLYIQNKDNQDFIIFDII